MDCILGGSGCSVGTCKGVQRRGRMAEVSGGLLLGGIMIMMIICVPQAKSNNPHGRNPVGGAYSEKCQSVFLWNSAAFCLLYCCHFCWEMWRNTEVQERRWQEGS